MWDRVCTPVLKVYRFDTGILQYSFHSTHCLDMFQVFAQFDFLNSENFILYKMSILHIILRLFACARSVWQCGRLCCCKLYSICSHQTNCVLFVGAEIFCFGHTSFVITFFFLICFIVLGCWFFRSLLIFRALPPYKYTKDTRLQQNYTLEEILFFCML